MMVYSKIYSSEERLTLFLNELNCNYTISKTQNGMFIVLYEVEPTYELCIYDKKIDNEEYRTIETYNDMRAIEDLIEIIDKSRYEVTLCRD